MSMAMMLLGNAVLVVVELSVAVTEVIKCKTKQERMLSNTLNTICNDHFHLFSF